QPAPRGGCGARGRRRGDAAVHRLPAAHQAPPDRHRAQALPRGLAEGRRDADVTPWASRRVRLESAARLGALRAFAKRDVGAVLARLQSDVEICQTELSPRDDHYQGHEGARELFGRLTATIDPAPSPSTA